MNKIFFRISFFIIIALFLVPTVSAAEITLDNGTLWVKGVDDPAGLGAVSVVLSYTDNVSIQSVEGKSGFLVASNIQNADGQTLIAGISTEGLTGDIPVASIVMTGNGEITIFVRDLGTVNADPIPCTNEEYAGELPTADSGNEETTGVETSVSQTGESSPSPEMTTVEPTEVTTKETEMPDYTPADTGPSVTPETSAAVDEVIETPVIVETTTESVPPTQSPLNLMILLIAIASVFILKNEK